MELMAGFSPKLILKLLGDSYSGWDNDKAGRMGAALSYFTVFSLAPMLLIIIAIASVAFGRAAAQGRIVNEISGLIGHDGAEAIQGMIANASQSGSTLAATIFGIAMLIFGATGVFVQLKESLNTVWHVEPKPMGTIKGFLMTRLVSFSMILAVAFLLLVSLVLSAILSAVGSFLSGLMPGLGILIQIFNFVFSFGVIAFVFALMFKYVPDAQVAWKDVWIGAAVTSLLFTIGKFAIGLYLGNSQIGSTFGAASSLVIVMLWTYYSALILLFGAEFTKVYADLYGSKIKPDENALKVDVKKVEARA